MPPKKIISKNQFAEETDTGLKKRGRPPKSKIITKQKISFEDKNEGKSVKDKDKIKENSEDEELVLHLPSFDNEFTDNKNVFTMIDTEVSDKKETTKKLLIESSEESSDYGNDVTKLIDEINKRETIIKNLKDNLKVYKNINQDNCLTITKENKKQSPKSASASAASSRSKSILRNKKEESDSRSTLSNQTSESSVSSKSTVSVNKKLASQLNSKQSIKASAISFGSSNKGKKQSISIGGR